jgi:hypothetical protein
LFTPPPIKVNFLQLSLQAAARIPHADGGQQTVRRKGNTMRRLPTRFALTASIATLLWAVPVSIDVVGPGATDANAVKTLGIGLKLDTAEARVGRPATPRSAAGVARRTTRAVRPVAPVARAMVVRPTSAAVAGTAAVVAPPAAARCVTVVVRGVKVRRCGRVY